MRKTLKLLGKELRFLKKTALLSAVILVIFVVATLGLISANAQLMTYLCNHIDEQGKVLSFFADTATFDQMRSEGLTYACNFAERRYVNPRANGKTFEMQQNYTETTEDGGTMTYLVIFNGYFVGSNQAFADAVAQMPVKGRWFANTGEICLSDVIAEEFGVSLGDKVTLDDEYTVVGILDHTQYVLCGYIVAVKNNVPLDEVYAQ